MRGISVDVRNADVLDLQHVCRCGQEFSATLHLCHQCRSCNLKELYPPDGIPPDRRSLWRRFMDWLDAE